MFKTVYTDDQCMSSVCKFLCKGVCQNKDNAKQQEAVRNLMKSQKGFENCTLPAKCPASYKEGKFISYCPYSDH